MKRYIVFFGIVALVAIGGLSVMACATGPRAESNFGFSRVYVGHSWGGERGGTTLDRATNVIETRLFVNSQDIITDVQVDFLQLANGNWRQRNNSWARVSINYSVNPTAIIPPNVTPGQSMFTIETNDRMSFYAVGVDTDGTVAFVFVDPSHRYQLEAKFQPGFNFDQRLGNLGQLEVFIPTILTSGGMIVPDAEWNYTTSNNQNVNLRGRSIFDSDFWNNVIYQRGVFQGTSNDTTLRAFLELAGVNFAADGRPQPMLPVYGFHSIGGWEGNYAAVRDYLVGRNIRELTSLIDYSSQRYAPAVSPNNFFHASYIPDGVTGATATAQNSIDGIAGATVRMSRENTSFQRALVAAGVITEDQVIRGRF